MKNTEKSDVLDRCYVISDNVNIETMLDQLAEECCELGHAALKLSRIMKDKNPTPISKDSAVFALHEEIADVFATIDLIGFSDEKILDEDIISKIEVEKIKRWYDRISQRRVEIEKH